MDSGDPQGERQFTVSNAISYMVNVKDEFQERPDVYNLFLDIMKDFKSQQSVSLISLFSFFPTSIETAILTRRARPYRR